MKPLFRPISRGEYPNRLKSDFLSLRMKSLYFRLASRKTRLELLGLQKDEEPVVPGEKARVPVSLEWQKQIFETTRQGNLWLQETYLEGQKRVRLRCVILTDRERN